MKTADLLAKWASETPDSVAIVSNGRSLTFAELNTLVMRLATKISSLGLSQSDLVAVRLGRSLDYPITLALMVLGIPSMSDVKGSNLAPGDYGVKYLFSGNRDESFDSGANIVVDQTWWSEMEQSPPEALNLEVDTESDLRLCLTSGSSGEPKACSFSLSEINARIERAGDGVYEFERVYSLVGLPGWLGFFLAYRNLVLGSTTYLFDSDSKNFLDLLISNSIQEIVGSPAQLGWLSKYLGPHAAKLWSLKKLTSTGGALSDSLLQRLRKDFKCKVSSGFGATECARIAYSQLENDSSLHKLEVLADTEVQIVDSAGQPLPFGTQGMLRVRNGYLATNYIRRDGSVEPVQTYGWFYPGDQATLDEAGLLEINHRDSDVTTVGGARVNLMIVEQALIDSGLVEDCKCLVFELPGQALEVLAIAFQSVSKPSDEEISKVVWGVLPEKLSLILHPMRNLPRSPSGKIGSIELAEIEKDLTAKLK